MNREELRAAQAPLKERYKAEPEAGLITLKAEGRLGAGVTCSIQTGKALVEAGLHPATGGPGTFACSGDMLLEALAACAGVTLSAVATSIGVEVRGGSVRAEGDLDFRGTLGVSKEAPVGFREIRLTFDLDTDAPADQLETLIKLTERYCVVFQTLRQAPTMTLSVI
jgi:uncharacterized OsmC-like protein